MKSLKAALTGSSTASAAILEVSLPELPKFDAKIDCGKTDFELGATLGTGTFGRVRVAKFLSHEEHPKSNKHYALKILKKSEILRLRQLAHIKNELTLLSMINNPFIVNMVNHFQDESKVYMILEFVPGGELYSYLRNEMRLSNDAARFYACQIVSAFGYLHSMKIAYRDLKPENLLIDKMGNLKIADFGFAKVVSTRTWTLCGTPEYLAPEILQGKGHGCAVDWWAFGILCYEMLTGYPPFYDENAFGIYQKILSGVVEYPKHMDKLVITMIKKLLSADLTKRLGCLKNGVEDVKGSKWFSGAKINWGQVAELAYPAPYIPPLSNKDDEVDTSNFDEYPDSPSAVPLVLDAEEAEYFAEFDTIGFQSKGGGPVEGDTQVENPV